MKFRAKAQSSKLILMLAFCLMATACGSSKSSSGSPESSPTTTLPAHDETDPSSIPSSDRSRTGRDKDVEIEVQVNTGSGLSFDGPASEQEIANLSNEGRRYSASTDDGLREFLAAKSERESDEAQRVRNLRFATSIITVKEKLTPKKTRTQVVIRLLNNGKEQDITFSGSLASQKKTNKIALTSKGKDGKNLKTQNGTLSCLDEDQPRMLDCQTKVAVLNVNKAQVRVILRKTPFDLHGSFAESKCKTEGCDNLYDLLRNTSRDNGAPNSIRNRVMESFEVIQGRSAFNILMYSRAGEAIKMAGALPNPEFYQGSSNTPLDTPLDRNLTDEERRNPATNELYKLKLQEVMEFASLVRNDGMGTIGIKVRLKPLPKEYPEFVDLEIKRQVKPIRALVDDGTQTTDALKRKLMIL